MRRGRKERARKRTWVRTVRAVCVRDRRCSICTRPCACTSWRGFGPRKPRGRTVQTSGICGTCRLQAGSTRRAWTQEGPTVCSVTALQTAGALSELGTRGVRGVSRRPRSWRELLPVGLSSATTSHGGGLSLRLLLVLRMPWTTCANTAVRAEWVGPRRERRKMLEMVGGRTKRQDGRRRDESRRSSLETPEDSPDRTDREGPGATSGASRRFPCIRTALPRSLSPLPRPPRPPPRPPPRRR